jgi:hypothetical protein
MDSTRLAGWLIVSLAGVDIGLAMSAQLTIALR